jgi:hypothetical protein
MNRGGLTARFTCICIWPNVYDGTRGAHVGHFRSGAGGQTRSPHDHHGHRSPFWVRVFTFSAEIVERNGDKTTIAHARQGSRARADGCGTGRPPGLHHPSPTVWSTTAVRSPACPGLVCLIHALLPLVRETRSSYRCHSFVQLFAQASHSVAASPFRSATSTTSTRRGRRRCAFVRGNLNRSSVRGGRRIHSLRKLSAVQAYRIGRRQVLPRRR